MGFSGLLGNSSLKQRLSASFAAGKSSHCYLLCGPKGSGKHTLAQYLSAAMECTGQDVPCTTCRDCRKALAGNHPDVITVDDPEKKIVPVDLIRKLQADAYIKPNEGRRKVYIIPRAMDMNDNAQNALLKLLEEPPAYAVFLLLTDNAEKLLPTVRSRCVELRLEPVEREQEQSPQTAEFARAFGEKDAMALAQLLSSMEKLPRAKLQELLEQWRELLAEALLARTGLTASRSAAAIGRSRTGAELNTAVAVLQKASEACTANLGTGHICGWLLVRLR